MGIFLSQSDLFHLIRPSLGLPTLLQMALFHSFLWPISHCIYVPRDHISMDGIAGTLMGGGWAGVRGGSLYPPVQSHPAPHALRGRVSA